MEPKELIQELQTAADMADDFGGDTGLYLIAIAHIRRLELELSYANGICRTAYAIAERKGEKTNWDGFAAALNDALQRQHRIMYPKTPNAA